MKRAKAWERRAAAKTSPLWRKPADEMPAADTTVLLLVAQDADPDYVTAGYDSGSCWRDAVGARRITGGHVRAWMPMAEAVRALGIATRGRRCGND